MTNLYSDIQSSLHAHAGKVIVAAGPRQLTAAQLDAEVGRYATALAALGLGCDDRLAAQVEKSVENMLLYLACLRIGAVYLPLNPAYQAAEIRYFLTDAAPRIFVATPRRAAELRPLAMNARVATLLTLDECGAGTLPDAVAAHREAAPCVARAADDLAVICYTSGTTGLSKGAMITHGNLLTNARTLLQLWGFTAADVLLHALPLYHIHGLFVALHCALLSGARLLFQPRFDAAQVLSGLQQATVMMGVPTFYTRLLAEPGLNAAMVRNVRVFISGSAPLLKETFASFEQRTGQRILERYGMTETGMIASNPLQGERRAGSVGRPLPGVNVRILDADGVALPGNRVGNVAVQGPNVFKGYWNMPEKTAAEIRADGYFITGDVGLLEPDGYLRLVGRAKDLIISGGLNVYPKEIEDVLDALEGIAESAVFAIPHADFGEAVAAAVVLQPGLAEDVRSSVGSERLMNCVRAQLAGFKTPKRIFIVDELPRNAMGKVQKAVLRERYREEFLASSNPQ